MKFKHALLAIFCLFTVEKVSAESVSQKYCGVDGVYSSIHLNSDSEFKSLKTSFPSINVFGGVHLDETVSVEGGIHFSKPSRTTVATIERQVETLGGTEHHAIHQGIAFFLDPYVSLNFSSPVISDGLKIFGGIGVFHSSVRYHIRSVYINGHRHDEEHRFDKSCFTHRVTIGAIYHINSDLSVRITSFFKNTSKLAASNHKINIKPKDSLHHAVGILYNF